MVKGCFGVGKECFGVVKEKKGCFGVVKEKVEVVRRWMGTRRRLNTRLKW